MQRLTIRAASPSSAQDLRKALSEFYPDFTTDDEGNCFVSVDLGSDRHVVFVLDSLQRFVESRAADSVVNTVVVHLDDRRYRIHGNARSSESTAPV